MEVCEPLGVAAFSVEYVRQTHAFYSISRNTRSSLSRDARGARAEVIGGRTSSRLGSAVVGSRQPSPLTRRTDAWPRLSIVRSRTSRAIERVLTPEDLEREALYAGEPGSQVDLPQNP